MLALIVYKRTQERTFALDIKLDRDTIVAIEQILTRGNTAEVKKRKDDIIVLEDTKKIKNSTPLKNG